jgi:hypothetical protein
MYSVRFLAVGVLVACGALPDRSLDADDNPGTPQTGRLTAGEFARLHKDLQPPKDELWRSIPWQVSIVAGRELAARQKKPIFVWVASGEPLGCG